MQHLPLSLPKWRGQLVDSERWIRTLAPTSLAYRVVKKDLNPQWEEDVSFVYETKLISKLHLKKLTLKVKDKDKWGSDDTIGTVQVDLYTLATGPSAHVLPLRDGGNTKGELCFSVEMEQEASLEINVKDVELTAPDLNPPEGEYVLQYMYNRGLDEDAKAARRSSPTTTTHFPYLDVLYVRTTYRELNAGFITVWARAGKRYPGKADGDVLARADVPLTKCMNFVDHKSTDFDVPLMDDAGARLGDMTGSIFFQNFPQFLQMQGGYHADDGIHQAQFIDADAPNKPKIFVHGQAGRESDAPAAAGGGAGGAPQEHIPSAMTPIAAASSGGFAASVRTVQLASTGMQLLRQGMAGGASNTAPSGAGGFAPAQPQSTATPYSSGQHMPATSAGFSQQQGGYPQQQGGYPQQQAAGWHQGSGSGSPSLSSMVNAARMVGRLNKTGALAAALSGGGAMAGPPQSPAHGAGYDPGASVTLPSCWERCVDPSTSRPYFKNHMYASTEWMLPTESTFSVTIAQQGRMGMVLETNFSGRAKTGVPSGRRNSGRDGGAVVNSVLEGSLAASLPGAPLRKGHHLIAINGQSCEEWPYATCMVALQQASRPLLLTFYNPYAVAPEVARAAQQGPQPAAHAHTPSGGGALAAALGGGFVGAPAPARAPAAGPAAFDDWVTLKDVSSGRDYYMNTSTKQVSWTWPPSA